MKGSLPKWIYAITTPLIFGIVALSVMGVANAEFIDLRKDIDRGIGQIGGTHWDLPPQTQGNIYDEEDAKKQMTGLIVWNSLAASHCEVLASARASTGLVYNDTAEGIDNIRRGDSIRGYRKNKQAWNLNGWFNKIDNDDIPGELDGYSDDIPSVPENNINAVWQGEGFQEGFRPLVTAGFTKRCLGAESAIKRIKNAVNDGANSFLSNIVSDISDTAMLIGISGLAITATVGCVVASGGACALAVPGAMASAKLFAAGAAGKIAATAGSTVLFPGASRNLDDDYSFDMEGKFGTIEFTSHETFHISSTSENPMFGLNFHADKNGNNWKGSDTTGFWRGKRFMHPIPAGMRIEQFATACGGQTGPGCEKDDWKDYNHRKTLSLTDGWEGSAPFDDSEENYGLDDSVDDSGIPNERLSRMLNAWRVRMRNVPIAAEKNLTPNRPPCNGNSPGNSKHPKCYYPNDELKYFLNKTSFVICENAKGKIQSNAKKVYDAADQKGSNSEKEDHVYPFVEITSNAYSCIDPDVGRRLEDYGHGDIVQYFEEIDDVVNQDDFECDDRRDVGRSKKLFEKEKADGGIFPTKLLCGGSEEEFEFKDYKFDSRAPGRESGHANITYHTPDPLVKGCSDVWFDIRGESWEPDVGDVTGYSWTHNTTYSYDAGDPPAFPPPDGFYHDRDQINHSRVVIDYERQEGQGNLSFVISFDWSNGGNDSIVVKEFMETDANSRNLRYYMFDDGSLVDGIDSWWSAGSGSDPAIEVRFNESVKWGDDENTDSKTGREGYLEEIEVEALTQSQADNYNSKISSNIFSENKEVFEVEAEKVYGHPRVCDPVR